LISLCEIFEQAPNYASEFFSLVIRPDNHLFNSYIKCMVPEEAQLLKLIELTKGDRILAEERQEDLLHLGVAILAAFTFVPLNCSPRSAVQKYKVSKYLAAKLLDHANMRFTENWLIFLKHSTSCINVLKAVYSLCLASQPICLYLAKNQIAMNAIYDILSDKASIFIHEFQLNHYYKC
jgi:hypothetical protein